MNSVVMAMIGAQALLGAVSQASDVEGFWLTADETAVIQIAPCETGSDQLCGVIQALLTVDTDQTVAEHVSVLCGMPILSGLVWDPERARWSDGEILDLDSEQFYQAYLKRDGENLLLRAYEGREMFGVSEIWTPHDVSSEGCEA